MASLVAAYVTFRLFSRFSTTEEEPTLQIAGDCLNVAPPTQFPFWTRKEGRERKGEGWKKGKKMEGENKE